MFYVLREFLVSFCRSVPPEFFRPFCLFILRKDQKNLNIYPEQMSRFPKAHIPNIPKTWRASREEPSAASCRISSHLWVLKVRLMGDQKKEEFWADLLKELKQSKLWPPLPCRHFYTIIVGWHSDLSWIPVTRLASTFKTAVAEQRLPKVHQGLVLKPVTQNCKLHLTQTLRITQL